MGVNRNSDKRKSETSIVSEHDWGVRGGYRCAAAS